LAQDDELLKKFNEQFHNMHLESSRAEVPPEEVEARRRRELNEKEVKVMGVFEHPHSGAFVLLRDNRERNLPIWIGQPEALSIQLALEGASPPRPMTHDLTRLILDRLHAAVEYVLVDDLYNNVYYAKLSIQHGDSRDEIDCRPSDAIAMAVRFRAPIYVADHVLEEGQWKEPTDD
jgi:uncharacterized protein